MPALSSKPMLRSDLNKYLKHTFVPLMFGLLVYLCFRQEGLAITNTSFIGNLSMTIFTPKTDSNWLFSCICYNLPDGLWIYSLVSFNIIYWRQEYTWAIIYTTLSLSIALSSEFMQLNGLINGTFDYLDLGFYIMFTMLAIAFASNWKLK